MCFPNTETEKLAGDLLSEMTRQGLSISSLDFKERLRERARDCYSDCKLPIVQTDVGLFLRSSFWSGKFPRTYTAQIKNVRDDSGDVLFREDGTPAVFLMYYVA